jgi:dephospho-CoA kinase
MNDERAIPVIGLLGGIGSGKSAAAGCFAELGAAVIDADELGHQALEEPEVRQAILQRWGEGVLTAGRVDRRRVGEIVFADASQLAFLNALTHPRIARLIARRLAAARADASVPAVVLDAAVLLEAGWDRFCTHRVFVQAPPSQRAARVGRRGWDESAWREREKSQISLDTKAAQCQYTIDNSSSLSCLREQVHRILHKITRPTGTA